MQRRASAFIGYTVESPDGRVGSVGDILFEDNNWKLRWFVVNAGSWLFGRQILIRPAALGRPDVRQRAFPVALTMAQVEAGPTIVNDPPVALQMDPSRGDTYFFGQSLVAGYDGAAGLDQPARGMSGGDDGRSRETYSTGDPHLRSVAEVTGYHIHALDGDIGHLEDFLVDDDSWKIEMAVVNTSNWGFGGHVLVAAADIRQVLWPEREIYLHLTRYKIKSSPSWQEPDLSDAHVG
jgi:hypothetical protein